MSITYPPEMLPTSEDGVVIIECPTCKGSGITYVDHDPDWCETCGGAGTTDLETARKA
jgi:DnaJ-class molecular chaperone